MTRSRADFTPKWRREILSLTHKIKTTLCRAEDFLAAIVVTNSIPQEGNKEECDARFHVMDVSGKLTSRALIEVRDRRRRRRFND